MNRQHNSVWYLVGRQDVKAAARLGRTGRRGRALLGTLATKTKRATERWFGKILPEERRVLRRMMRDAYLMFLTPPDAQPPRQRLGFANVSMPPVEDIFAKHYGPQNATNVWDARRKELTLARRRSRNASWHAEVDLLPGHQHTIRFTATRRPAYNTGGPALLLKVVRDEWRKVFGGGA